MPLRVVFMGTPDLAAVSLRALLAGPEFQVVAVATQPDRPKGRELKLQSSPVKQLATESRIPVLQPERARDEHFCEQLTAWHPELIAVAAYGQILPRRILDLPRYGCVNVHTSLLPKFRGAAPIQWAILRGETETGVTIMRMDPGLDTGDILSQEKTPITPQDTAQTLHDRLAEIGAKLLVRTLPEFVAGRISPRPQAEDQATHAPKIRKQDGLLHWHEPASELWNRVRGLSPWPGAFTHLPVPGRELLLKIWEVKPVDQSGPPGCILQADKTGIVVACGTGALRLESLQLEGARRLGAREFLAGHPLRPGQVLA